MSLYRPANALAQYRRLVTGAALHAGDEIFEHCNRVVSLGHPRRE